jgi:hypothetical protein
VDHVGDVLTVVALGFVALRLADGVRHSRSSRGRELLLSIVRGIRWRHVWPVPFVLTGVVTLASLLVLVPGLDWGWWSALGGEGNPAMGSTERTSGTALEWAIPLVFMVMLGLALPLFAHAEERMFRVRAELWSRRKRALKVVQFGLVHALIGIPIGVALALSIGGAYFMAVYLRRYRATGSRIEATLESARAHTVYNAVIVSLVLALVVVDAVA